MYLNKHCMSLSCSISHFQLIILFPLYSILDLDPEKSLKSQLAPAEGDDGVPLKDDPKYVKYYKMMKMGLPKEAVQHAMTRDQMDPRYVYVSSCLC